MEFTYEVSETPLKETVVLRSDGAVIPLDPANSDYQAYLNKDNPNAPTTFPHQPLVEG
jgi:hypothetical protein